MNQLGEYYNGYYGVISAIELPEKNVFFGYSDNGKPIYDGTQQIFKNEKNFNSYINEELERGTYRKV